MKLVLQFSSSLSDACKARVHHRRLGENAFADTFINRTLRTEGEERGTKFRIWRLLEKNRWFRFCPHQGALGPKNLPFWNLRVSMEEEDITAELTASQLSTLLPCSLLKNEIMFTLCWGSYCSGALRGRKESHSHTFPRCFLLNSAMGHLFGLSVLPVFIS